MTLNYGNEAVDKLICIKVTCQQLKEKTKIGQCSTLSRVRWHYKIRVIDANISGQDRFYDVILG